MPSLLDTIDEVIRSGTSSLDLEMTFPAFRQFRRDMHSVEAIDPDGMRHLTAFEPRHVGEVDPAASFPIRPTRTNDDKLAITPTITVFFFISDESVKNRAEKAC